MASSKHITNSIFKQLQKWNIDKAIDNSNDESNTRDALVRPFFEILGFQYMNDYQNEFIADMNGKKSRKVDIAFLFGKNSPSIIVECKRANLNLNDSHYRQLNEYAIDLPSVKVGIVTNGVVYDFYTKSGNTLNPKPFFSFDITDYDLSDIENLSLFEKSNLSFDLITEEAEETYFLEKFDIAFYNTLKNPSKKTIAEIYHSMGGKKTSPKIETKIKSLINHISLRNASNKMLDEAASNSANGIITTEEEVKFFNIVKTILGLSNKFKNTELDRIQCKDYKNFFAIQVDDTRRKKVVILKYKSRKPILEIGKDEIILDEVSVAEITKHKSKIINSAVSLLV